MALREVDYEHLVRAMAIIDEIGIDAARERCNVAILPRGGKRTHGFQRARTIHVVRVGGGEYEHRVLIALAHALQFPGQPALQPKSFDGFNLRAFLNSINEMVGPTLGWTQIQPDPEVERAFDAAFAEQ